MSNMDDPYVRAFDKVVNTIRVSCDQPAAQLSSPRVPDTQMRSRGDKRNCVEDRLANPVSRDRVLSSNVFNDLMQILACARCEPERHDLCGLNSAAISSVDTHSPRLA